MSKNKPGKALNVLIIDDDPSFVEGLQRNANPFRIRLEHETNLEDGLLKLQKRGERYFVGVILDVICLKDRKQQIPDPSFISKAMEEFNRRAPSLPKVILSGEPTIAESVKQFYDGNTETYHKSAEQIEEMLSFLVKQSESQSTIKFAKKYPDIFSLFENDYLNHGIEMELVTVLEKMESYEPTVISSNLARLRRIQEAIYLALNKLDPSIVLTSDIDKNGPQCRKIMGHLVHKGYVERDKIVARASDLAYSLACDYGSHVSNTTPDYSPTKYTVQMCTFAIFDLLTWFKSVAEKNDRG
jgi:ActR/RegA family two-component response regulator